MKFGRDRDDEPPEAVVAVPFFFRHRSRNFAPRGWFDHRRLGIMGWRRILVGFSGWVIMVDDVAVSHGSAASESIERPTWFEGTAILVTASALAMGGLRGLQILAIAGQAGALGVLGWVDALARAGYVAVAHGLVGLVLASLVRALGAWIGDGGGSKAREDLPSRAASIEVEPPSEPASAAKPAEALGEVSREALDSVRRLIDARDWDEADARVGDLLAEHPGDRRVERLVEQLRRAKQTLAERWSEQLRVAREVNDPNRVLELYDETPPIHDEEDRRLLDQDTAKWFLSLVHRRLRGGGAQLEIVTLAERVSESFAHTVEGASLRAALPTLRRSVGLCPRCAKPYVGTAEACPECLAGKTAAESQESKSESTAEAVTADFDDLDDLARRSRDSEWFIEREDDDSEDAGASA